MLMSTSESEAVGAAVAVGAEGAGAVDAVCRVCLAGGSVRLLSVRDQHLLETYEKLTSSKLNAEDGRPNRICYICHHQLQRCSRFSAAARRADDILTELLQGDAQATYGTLTSLNETETTQQLSMTDVWYVSMDESDAEYNVTDKRREFKYIHICTDIKEESAAVEEETREVEGSGLSERDDEDCLKKEQTTKGSIKNSIDNEHLNLHCDRCDQTFNKLLNFKTHMRTHAQGNLYECNSCRKTFKSPGHLARHTRSHIKAYVCDRCSSEFKLKSAFEAHMRTHTGEKPFSCEACGKTFNQRSHLSTHARTHSPDKPFSCAMCDKAFRQRAQLLSHMRTHTGERPFKCSRCHMSFGHQTTLRKHTRLHTEVKSHPCSDCPLSFDTESGLRGHMRTHTAVRRHACLNCDKSFLEARHLKEHTHCVHGGTRPHACACGRAFKRAEHLKQHSRSSLCKEILA